MLRLLMHNGKIISGICHHGNQFQLKVYTPMLMRHASRVLQTETFTVIMVEDAMNCLRRAVWSFLRRGKITNSLSALTRFDMCCKS